MDVFEAIYGRRSIGKMTDERPPREAVERLLGAAIEAPNHHETQPWRFFVLRGRAREEFGEVLADALKRRGTDMEASKLEGLLVAERAKPLRSPVLVVVAAEHGESDDAITRAEDFAATAAAVENMLLAAQATGLAAHWRTGDGAYDAHVKAWFGLKPADDIVAVVYIGYADWTREQQRERRRDHGDRTRWIGWDD